MALHALQPDKSVARTQLLFSSLIEYTQAHRFNHIKKKILEQTFERNDNAFRPFMEFNSHTSLPKKYETNSQQLANNSLFITFNTN